MSCHVPRIGLSIELLTRSPPKELVAPEGLGKTQKVKGLADTPQARAGRAPRR